MLKHNLFVLWNFRGLKFVIYTKTWTSEVCLAPLQNPFQAYTFLSENTPWTYCKREQSEIENSNFLPRWHLGGKLRALFLEAPYAYERRGETETYPLTIFYEIKILEIRKTLPAVGAKVTAGCILLEAPGPCILIILQGARQTGNVKHACFIFSTSPLHPKAFIFKEPKRNWDFNCVL